EREPGDDAEAAAATALQPPEQVGISTRIDDTNLAIGGDHLGFEQSTRGAAVILREAAEAAALDQPRDADGRASAALDVSAAFRGHRVIDMHPDGAGLDCHSGLRRLHASTAPCHEPIVQLDTIHRSRPYEQRIGCV